jgi:DNA-directed RNA polymerase subunit beta'
MEREVNGEIKRKLITTTVGRIIFNEPIPQDLGFVDRNDPERMFDLEINFTCGKKQLGKIIEKCIYKHGFTRSAEVLDEIKALGFKYSTQGALTISISDMTVPGEKQKLIAETEDKILKIESKYKKGFLTNDERYRLVVNEWDETTKKVTAALQNHLDRYNPIFMMADSGARGTMNQIRQLACMRVCWRTPTRTFEFPSRQLREGLSVLGITYLLRGAQGYCDNALVPRTPAT